ncbi:MAG TPA: hypothetical protein VM030_10360 [Acidimicrobiales bacterium]|nr:hypothetical protein [Acidimicrobiales bacterium]
MPGFIQIIEFTTSRFDEVSAAVDAYLEESKGTRKGVRGSQTKDRDKENTYVEVVEFPSYEAAMENSNSPETTAFAEKMQSLCDGPPIFRNLDVIRTDEM